MKNQIKHKSAENEKALEAEKALYRLKEVLLD